MLCGLRLFEFVYLVSSLTICDDRNNTRIVSFILFWFLSVIIPFFIYFCPPFLLLSFFASFFPFHLRLSLSVLLPPFWSLFLLFTLKGSCTLVYCDIATHSFPSCRQPRERFSVLYMLYREEAVALALHIFYKLLLLYSNLLRWFEVKRPAIGGLGSSETRDRDPESVLHGGNKKERLVWNSGRWPEQVVIGDLNCGVLWEARRHSSWPLWGDHAARINK